jgi:hypothetical protein
MKRFLEVRKVHSVEQSREAEKARTEYRGCGTISLAVGGALEILVC